MKKIVGTIIKQFRLDRGLKQEYLAYKLSITVESYANIESGRVDINTQKLKQIAIVFDTKPSSIISIAEQYDN